MIHRDAVVPFQAPDGAIVRELASPHNTSLTRHSLAEITYPPGTTSAEGGRALVLLAICAPAYSPEDVIFSQEACTQAGCFPLLSFPPKGGILPRCR